VRKIQPEKGMEGKEKGRETWSEIERVRET
jgi:hypothetical protein